MHIIIVAERKLAYFLCRAFQAKNYEVTVINRDREDCSWLARRTSATIVFGDGSSPQVLEDAGAETVDAVLAAAPRDEDNLVTCQLADMKFHVPRIISLVNDPDNEQVFRQLGIANTFSITLLLSSLIEQRVDSVGISDLIPVAEGKITVTEVKLTDKSPAAGKAMSEIQMPENSLVACVLREDQAIVPRGTTVIAASDRLIVISEPQNHSAAMKTLTGEPLE
ncbi:MAG TPA: TrkA family potassium uptake protein [Candidatus Bathyarchaeia archaeon]|nr:TrkA family potassium uptake protein [Candidatus Bathyarchaeia archaeon]